MRNGTVIPVPVCQPSQHASDDFYWISDDTYGDSTMSWKRYVEAADASRPGSAFVIPKGAFFLLNDKCNSRFDSGLFGPLPRANLSGRPLVAYNPQRRSWSLLR
jgi:hypothetical protein